MVVVEGGINCFRDWNIIKRYLKGYLMAILFRDVSDGGTRGKVVGLWIRTLNELTLQLLVSRHGGVGLRRNILQNFCEYLP